MSSIIDRAPKRVGGAIPAEGSLWRVRKPLLVCGIAASLLYGAMIWVIKYEGYSPISQTVSELSAWGVSTRPLWMVLGSLYDALMIAFALGVWASAGGKRWLRIAGGLLFVYGLLGLAWPFAAMHQRQVLVSRRRAQCIGNVGSQFWRHIVPKASKDQKRVPLLV